MEIDRIQQINRPLCLRARKILKNIKNIEKHKIFINQSADTPCEPICIFCWDSMAEFSLIEWFPCRAGYYRRAALGWKWSRWTSPRRMLRSFILGIIIRNLICIKKNRIKNWGTYSAELLKTLGRFFVESRFFVSKNIVNLFCWLSYLRICCFLSETH